MASPIVSRAPNCMSCSRRISLFGDVVSPLGRQQTRGKKFVAKTPSSVKVQLLESIPGYGKKGSVVPITPGVMRNIWYPRKMATYVTMSTLQGLGGKDIAAERDPLFGTNKERKAATKERREAKAAAAIPVEEAIIETVAIPTSHTPSIAEISTDSASPTLLELSNPPPAAEESGSLVSEGMVGSSSPAFELPQAELMTPEIATRIVSKLLPESIDFFRIPATKPLKAVSSSLSSGAVRSAAARAQAAKTLAEEKKQKNEIHGSVSKSDIEATLKTILAADEEGRRIALSAKNVTLRDETADNEGIKHLGTFEVNIHLEGSAEVVKRVIRVVAQGES